MKFLSLFSGAGLFDYGLELAGWTVVGQVEIDPFARQLLDLRWPDVPKEKDIRGVSAVRFAVQHGSFDAIVGGFPCNNISNAHTNGARKALQGDKSRLWTEQQRCIIGYRPRIAVVENAGAWRRWVPDVRRDLWRIGYASVPLRLRADSFGAPHGRDRVFVVAHANRESEPLRALHAEVASLRPVSGLVRTDGRAPKPDYLRADDGAPGGVDRCRVVGEGVDVRVARWLGEAVIRCCSTES